MVEIRKPIFVREAIASVMQHVNKSGSEIVPLFASLGRILAEPIVAKHNVPPFHRSPYDGFAIRAEDSAGASGNNPIPFRVIDHIGAGIVSNRVISRGEAVRLMTGAPLPDGADAVVMFEQTSEVDGGFTIRKSFEKLENVSLMGEDAMEGETIIPDGSYIHPGIVALLATFGYAEVVVAKKPIVGILATGTELLQVHEELTPGKIRDSNGPMIIAQLARMGIQGRFYGALKDDVDECFELVEKTLAETDIIITTGGVSVGDFDFLPEIYERLGAKVLFNKVAMRPGSVTTVAVLGNKLLFGLSGNPSACYTGFELFTRPALLATMGCNRPYLPHTKAILTEDFKKANPFTRFIRAIYYFDGHQACTSPAGFNKSNAVTSVARGNAFIVLPGGSRGYEKGMTVDVLLLGVDEGVSEWTI